MRAKLQKELDRSYEQSHNQAEWPSSNEVSVCADIGVVSQYRVCCCLGCCIIHNVHGDPQQASGLQYLNHCIKEAMRLWPVAGAGSGRSVPQDLEYNGNSSRKQSQTSTEMIFRLVYDCLYWCTLPLNYNQQVQ